MIFSGSADVGAWLAGLGIIVFVLGIKISQDADKDMKIRDAGCYIAEKGILSIKERKPAIANVIKIVNDEDYTVAYEPEKIHVGAVTVGGVTTGGVYKTGGYHYVSGAKKNGLCRLEFLGNIIRSIQLTDEQFSLAKASTISQYLNHDKKQIQVIDPVEFSEIETRMMLNNLSSSGYMNMGSDLMKKGKQGYPTYEKCIEIMNWLCRSNDNPSKNSRPPEQNRILSENEWKCPKCGRINQNYVGTCGCGETKPR